MTALGPGSWDTAIDHGRIDVALARALEEHGEPQSVDVAQLVRELDCRGYRWAILDRPDASALGRSIVAAAQLPSGYVRPALFAAAAAERGVPLIRVAR